MNTFLRVDINIAGIILFGIILFVALGRLELRDKLNRAFIITSAIIILELFFETATCVVNGRGSGFIYGALDSCRFKKPEKAC